MSQLEQTPAWSRIVALMPAESLERLAERFRSTPGAIAAAWARTGPHAWEIEAPTGPEELPPEPGDAAEAPAPTQRPARTKAAPPPHAAPRASKGGAGTAQPGVVSAWRLSWREGGRVAQAVVLSAELGPLLTKVEALGELVALERLAGDVVDLTR